MNKIYYSMIFYLINLFEIQKRVWQLSSKLLKMSSSECVGSREETPQIMFVPFIFIFLNCFVFHSLMVRFVRGWNEKLVAGAKWGFIQRLAAWLGRDWWSHSDKFLTARMRLSLDMLFHWTSSLYCYLDHYWQTVKDWNICFIRAEA